MLHLKTLALLVWHKDRVLQCVDLMDIYQISSWFGVVQVGRVVQVGGVGGPSRMMPVTYASSFTASRGGATI